MASLQRTKQPGDMVTKRQIRGAILPWEKQLIDTLGLTLEEYQWYANAVANYRPERDPAYDHVPDVVCTGFETFLVTTIVGSALSVASSALAPKPKLPKQSDPGQQQNGGDLTGVSVNVENRFTNIDGFTSVQPLARLGESMQLVFANRQGQYGGVRVETKLLWSQLLSKGDGQELLALFLANGGELAAQPDFDGMAIGDSLLRGYLSDKLAMYFRNGNVSNRITENDKKAGNLKPRNFDPFNTELRVNDNMQPIFSGTRIPSTMTIFGISEPLRNAQDFALPFKRVRVVLPPYTGGNNAEALKEYVKVEQSFNRSKDERNKILCKYASRTGLNTVVRSNGTTIFADNQRNKDVIVQPGDLIKFEVYGANSSNDFRDSGNSDVKSKENGIRAAVDDKIIVGESYLVGSVEAICSAESTPAPWNDGLHKTFTFKAVTAGQVRINHEGLIIHGPDFGGEILADRINYAYGPTLCKLAIANIVTTRKLTQVEIGIKSQVFKRFNGIANFGGIPPDAVMDEIEAGGGTYNVGSFSDYGLRYSFFRVEIKEKGTNEWFSLLMRPGLVFCVKGRSPVNQFNFIRIAFRNTEAQYGSTYVQYEIRFKPISGGEYTTYLAGYNDYVFVLDCRTGSPQQYAVMDQKSNNFVVSFRGSVQKIPIDLATNPNMFYGPAYATRIGGGTVSSINTTTFKTNTALASGVFSTAGGSGSGLTVRVSSTKSAAGAPSATAGGGLQDKWFHLYTLSAPTPTYEGQTHGPWGAIFNNIDLSNGVIDAKQSVQINFVLKSVFGSNPSNGYSSGQKWFNSYYWVAQITNGNLTVITATAGAPGGTYIIPKSTGASYASNTDQNAVIVLAYPPASFDGQIQVSAGGSGYKENESFTVNNTGITMPLLKINLVSTATVQGIRYAEPFDAVADVYVYDQQEGSHENGPEHEIVYVNEQRENFARDFYGSNIAYGPTYSNMTLLGLQLRSGKEWNNFNNFTYYAKKGCKVKKFIRDDGSTDGYGSGSNILGASNLFPEILAHLILTSRSALSYLIDLPGFQEACKVCIANNLYWDGVISAPVNVREWGFQNAQYFFLDLLVSGGKLSLQPTFPVDLSQGINGYTLNGAYNRKPKVSALFTDGNIIEDSLSVNWYPSEQRIAPEIIVTLRDEVENGFAETRNIWVKLKTSVEPPSEAIDFTGFCGNRTHAIQFAKLIIQMRSQITHVITFKTLPTGLGIAPGQYFKVSSQARHIEQFQNGYVLNDGTVVSSGAMGAGSYSVYFWRSGLAEVQTKTMVINANGLTAPEFANGVFTQYTETTNSYMYKAELIVYDEDGMVEISGSHVPLTADGKITYLNLNDDLFYVQNEQ